MEISWIVLAGGRSTRLGRDKTQEKIFNRSLLQIVVDSLRGYDCEIIITTAANKPLQQCIDHPKLRIVGDVYPDKGPLGGIYTGLTESNSFYNLVTAGDMPFLNQNLLLHMLQISADSDVVIPRLNGQLEPLHGIYSKDCLATMECLLKLNNPSVLQLLASVKTRHVEIDEINRFDPEHLSFFNINNENDLNRARELAKRRMKLN